MKISKPAFHKAGFLLLKHFAFARFYGAGYAVFIHGDIHVGRVFREIFAEPHFYRAAARDGQFARALYPARGRICPSRAFESAPISGVTGTASSHAESSKPGLSKKGTAPRSQSSDQPSWGLILRKCGA